MHFFRVLTLAGSAALLAACGGGSDSSNATYPNGYIQFYNGSADSAQTVLKLTKDSTDSVVGGAPFADTTALTAVTAGTYDYDLYYTNSAGDTVIKKEDKVTLKEGEKNLLIMAGSFASPDVLTVNFQRDDTLDSQFKVAMVNLINNSNSYDLYLAASGKAFSDATLVGTAAYKAQSQFQTLATGSYTLYVTKGGDKTPLYQSELTSFGLETEYVLVLRNATGPAQSKLTLDMIANTTTVAALEDKTAPAQVRVYNSINSINNGKIFLGENTAAPLIDNLAADTLSAYTDVTAGDYRIALADSNSNLVMRNGLVTLSQGVVKSVVFYTDKNNSPAAITVTDSKSPQVFEFTFNAVNTIGDYDQVSLYFVKPGYTMDNTAYYVSTLNYASQVSVTLPAGEYTMYVVHRDANNNKSLLAQTELTELVTGSNYLLVAEKDDSASSGFKLSLQK